MPTTVVAQQTGNGPSHGMKGKLIGVNLLTPQPETRSHIVMRGKVVERLIAPTQEKEVHRVHVEPRIAIDIGIGEEIAHRLWLPPYLLREFPRDSLLGRLATLGKSTRQIEHSPRRFKGPSTHQQPRLAVHDKGRHRRLGVEIINKATIFTTLRRSIVLDKPVRSAPGTIFKQMKRMHTLPVYV